MKVEIDTDLNLGINSEAFTEEASPSSYIFINKIIIAIINPAFINRRTKTTIETHILEILNRLFIIKTIFKR